MDEARAAAKRVIGSDARASDKRLSIVQLADLERISGNCRSAADYYTSALALEPSYRDLRERGFLQFYCLGMRDDGVRDATAAATQAVAANDQESASYRFDEARLKFVNGDEAASAGLLTFVNIGGNLGSRAAALLGDYSRSTVEAVRWYETAVRLGESGDPWPFWRLRALDPSREGKQRRCDEIRARFTNSGYSHICISLSTTNTDDALRELDVAITQLPRLAFAHYQRASLLDDKSDYRGSAAAADQALRIDPDYLQAEQLASLARARGRFDLDRAEVLAREALEASDELWSHRAVAEVEDAKQHWPAVGAEWQWILDHGGDVNTYAAYLASSYEFQGEWSKALEAIDRAIGANDRYPSDHYQRAHYLAEMGKDHADVIAEYRAGVARDTAPGVTELIKAELYQSALGAAELQVATGIAGGHANRADALYHLGKYDEMVLDLRWWLEHPDDVAELDPWVVSVIDASRLVVDRHVRPDIGSELCVKAAQHLPTSDYIIDTCLQVGEAILDKEKAPRFALPVFEALDAATR